MNLNDISDFMLAGGQHVPGRPNWTPSPFEIDQYISRVESEVEETITATWGGPEDYVKAEATGETFNPIPDVPEVVDGFLDIAYAAFTGALNVAGLEKTRACWEAIVDANLAKVDGRFGPAITDPESEKILKPIGWKAPDIEGILGR